MLHYCKKCGRILEIDTYDTRKKFKCDCCNSAVEPIPNVFLDDDLDCCFKDKNTEQKFINEYIKTSPEFDQYLFDHREEILAKQSAKFNAALEHGRQILEEQNCVPKCPICSSTNIKKITVGSRAVKTAVFGVVGAVDDAGKTYKCGNCGSRF